MSDRIKFTSPDGSVTVRDLEFSQVVAVLGSLSEAERELFWKKTEVQLPVSNVERPFQGYKAFLVREGV